MQMQIRTALSRLSGGGTTQSCEGLASRHGLSRRGYA
jgi:hypothetical protein